MKLPRSLSIYVTLILCAATCSASAAVILSTISDDTLRGLAYSDDDAVAFDPSTGASLYFDGDASFSVNNEDIDALHVLGNGNLVLSIRSNNGATLGGLSFEDEDLVEYNPNTKVATLLFDGSAVLSGPSDIDIDAAHVLPNGNLVLSHHTTQRDSAANATLGGLTFGEDDLVEYNPQTDQATLFFDGGSHFSNTKEDLNAVHVKDDGNLLLSTRAAASLGQLSFEDEDLVEYNPKTKFATLYFDGSAEFLDPNGNSDINAVSYKQYQPAPETSSVVVWSLLALFGIVSRRAGQPTVARSSND